MDMDSSQFRFGIHKDRFARTVRFEGLVEEDEDCDAWVRILFFCQVVNSIMTARDRFTDKKLRDKKLLEKSYWWPYMNNMD